MGCNYKNTHYICSNARQLVSLWTNTPKPKLQNRERENKGDALHGNKKGSCEKENSGFEYCTTIHILSHDWWQVDLCFFTNIILSFFKIWEESLLCNQCVGFWHTRLRLDFIPTLKQYQLLDVSKKGVFHPTCILARFPTIQNSFLKAHSISFADFDGFLSYQI